MDWRFLDGRIKNDFKGEELMLRGRSQIRKPAHLFLPFLGGFYRIGVGFYRPPLSVNRSLFVESCEIFPCEKVMLEGVQIDERFFSLQGSR